MAESPYSFDTPRQRQIKLRAASSLGQPRSASASLGQLAAVFWLAGLYRPYFPRRFGKLPATEVPPASSAYDALPLPFPPGQGNSLTLMKPVAEQRSLTVAWRVPVAFTLTLT